MSARTRRSTTLLAGSLGTTALIGALALPAAGAPRGHAVSPAPASAPAGGEFVPPTGKLTNLAHLRWLLDDVPLLPRVPGHTTYRIATEPTARAPWTYADRQADGTYKRIGGGDLDAMTGYYGQGAYNADDIARTAVVFLKDWRQNGSTQSRKDAYDNLRSLTYLQTTTGPNAGNVVLWQQADGTLTPSATPKELPDPSDSDESYWLARTVWALGEGYAAFRDDDPSFARFLRQRLHLAISALERASLGRQGFAVADGVPVPRWLSADGADATAEAVLGLSAFVAAAPSDAKARWALGRYADAVARMSSGNQRQWPFGAIMPWAKSQSLWHAWGGETPAALAAASKTLGWADARRLRSAIVGDAGVFTPTLMTAGGPYNAWAPMPGEAQISYGAEGRIAALLGAADATGGPGFVRLAGLAGGWYFGANPSGQPVYDPATGVAFDGVETDGRINRNSGAESTIHAQLAMLALDARPAAARVAASITGIVSRTGLRAVEAEGGSLTGGAAVVRPPSAWTGEANWSGGAYVDVPAGATVRIPVEARDRDSFVGAVIHRASGPSGTSRWYAVSATGRSTPLGTIANGGAGPKGITENDGVLKPFALAKPLPTGTTPLRRDDGGAPPAGCRPTAAARVDARPVNDGWRLRVALCQCRRGGDVGPGCQGWTRRGVFEGRAGSR